MKEREIRLKHMWSDLLQALKLNLTKDRYETVRISETGMTLDAESGGQVSEWFHRFAWTGNVYEEDMETYLWFAELDYLRKLFREDRSPRTFYIRAKCEDEFRWVEMRLIPCLEYSDEEQVVMLFIHDVHEEYSKTIHKEQKMEFYCWHDRCTGMWNWERFRMYCGTYQRQMMKKSIGMILVDLAGVAQINREKGYEQGDAFILKHAKMIMECVGKNMCYRMSGRKIIVLLEDMEEPEVSQLVETLQKKAGRQEKSGISFSWAWEALPQSIDSMLQRCEAAL